jgi:hypothetical protein
MNISFNHRFSLPPNESAKVSPKALQANPSASTANVQSSNNTPSSGVPPEETVLLENYIGVALRKLNGEDAGLVTVPPQTLLGQWLDLYRTQLEHPVMQNWMREQNIDPASVTINPKTGDMAANVGTERKHFTLTDGSDWRQMSTPLLAAAKVLLPTSDTNLHVRFDKDTMQVDAKTVADFHGVRLPRTMSQARTEIRRFEQKKSFDAIPADDKQRPASKRSAHAIESQKLSAKQFYAAAPQTVAYQHLAADLAQSTPDVRGEAKKWAEALIFKLTGEHVNADEIYLNRFKDSQTTTSATGWEHLKEEPSVSLRLPDALLKNFSEHDWIPGELDREAGLYKDGPGKSEQGGYGAHNQFPLAPSALMHASWKDDFQTVMTEKLGEFWKTHGDDFRTALKGEFVKHARQQLRSFEAKLPAEQALQPPEHRFTREDYRLVMNAASNLPASENAPLTVAQLQAQAPVKDSVQTHAFDINGWASNDIIRFAAKDETKMTKEGRQDGKQILYIPRAQPAFLKFASLAEMDTWVVNQAKEPKTREALASHFSLWNRQDSALFFGKYGVDSSLEHLGNHSWTEHEGATIDRANIAIKGDVFTHIRNQTKERMSSDADIAIKSNSEVTRDTWLNDISAASGLLVKMAPIAFPVEVAAVTSGIATGVLGAEKTASGDTKAERSDGAWKTLDGSLSVLFSLGASTVPEDPFELPEGGFETKGDEVANGGASNTTETEEPKAGSSKTTETVHIETDRQIPVKPSEFINYPVENGESLLEGVTPNSKGMYMVADRWFIRVALPKGLSKVFEISSDFRLREGKVKVVKPGTDLQVGTLYSKADGGWTTGDLPGGQRWWPWKAKPPTEASSTQEVAPPKFANQFEEFDGTPMKGAETFDKYTNPKKLTEYVLSTENYEDGDVIKRRLKVNWTGKDSEYLIPPQERAKPSEYGQGEYSDQFITDINRGDYTVRVGEEEFDMNLVKFKAETNYPFDEQINRFRSTSLAKLEKAVPDADLRARISEVANQATMASTLDELAQPFLKEGLFPKAVDFNYLIDYNPLTGEANVTVHADWSLLDLSGDERRLITDLQAQSTRTFKIRRSNEINGDEFKVEGDSPSKIELSVKP